MFQKGITYSTFFFKTRISLLMQYLLRDEAASGKFLLFATAAALIWANLSLSGNYEQFWLQRIQISLGGWGFSETYRDFINEGLMTLFFLVAGLEIKREIVRGELKKAQVASLPIAAATGGMLIPALIYAATNWGYGGLQGWGISMATDIAFAVGILALLGNRIPVGLKIFLLTLAVVDDIGAIIIISVFYTRHISIEWLLVAIGIVGLVYLLKKIYLLQLRWFIVLGIMLWAVVLESGIHASISGVILGLIAPMTLSIRRVDALPLAERLERSIIPLTTFVIMPLFALANAGVIFRWDLFQNEDASRVAAGIALGLIVGKAVGIVATSWLAVKFYGATLPSGVTWRHIIGVGFLGGIGFTLSLFMAEIAFVNEVYLAPAKVSIFAASLVSGLLGLIILYYTTRKLPRSK